MDMRQEYQELVARSEWVMAREYNGAIAGYWRLKEDWEALSKGDLIATIIYETTGIVMVVNAWQSGQPDMIYSEDIAHADWTDVDEYPATMLDGMPVRFV